MHDDDERRGQWIQTFTGRKVWPLDVHPEDLDLTDIAHALANICRYGGHCRTFYSVAQHSVIVSHVVPPDMALTGLMHDAAEAYLGDVPRPLKHGPGYSAFRRAEQRLERAVSQRWGTEAPVPEEVAWADNSLLLTEARDILAPLVDSWGDGIPGEPFDFTIHPWLPEAAEVRFIQRFHYLTGGRYDEQSRAQEAREAASHAARGGSRDEPRRA